MTWPRHLLHPPPPSPSRSPSPPSPPSPRISPKLLLIIIIITAAFFFISALVYFLIRFFKKRPNGSSSSNNQSNGDPAISTAEALQRQLQNLFSLHDSGLDQASIDALPVFSYKEILGPKEPFDCAVCLCEFSPKDKLRLLPNCSHAFHIKCIDTWLLTNSSCPLCRGAIFAPGLLIESPNSESGESTCSAKGKTAQIEENCGDKKGVLPVRLGKFRKIEGESGDSFVGEASNSNLDARRCYSMGSYQYVVGNTNLRVTLCPRRRKAKKVVLDRAENVDSGSPVSEDISEGRKISSVSKGDSYSISKIWLWKKKGATFSSSSGVAQIDLPSLGVESEYPVMERAENV